MLPTLDCVRELSRRQTLVKLIPPVPEIKLLNFLQARQNASYRRRRQLHFADARRLLFLPACPLFLTAAKSFSNVEW